MKINNDSAPSASSSNKIMVGLGRGKVRHGWAALIVGSLVACTSPPETPTLPTPGTDDSLPPPIQRGASRWVPVRWTDLPGWGLDSLHEVWDAWMRSCERPQPKHPALCAEMRPLTTADTAEQQAWIESRFQPYRVVEPDGRVSNGLLTGYYEPIMTASRQRTFVHRTPLYAPPTGLSNGQPWFSRQEIDTLPAAQAALKGRAVAWLADPIDALILQIQGSGRLQFKEADGSVSTVRMAFAGHNGHPYQSVGKWLLDQGAVRDTSWDGIKAWAASNPGRLNEMLWSNPRTVFFKEVKLSALDARFGPHGAQGVPLTPGRSIAVDPQSIPYGTPVWIATHGTAYSQQRLVMAQDTGGAIVGAARADLFTGWGDAPYQIASRLKQPVQMWALWPR